METHTVKAVKLRPRTQGCWADEVSEDNEESDSKSAPIISSDGSYPWNIDGDLLEVPSELYIRYSVPLLVPPLDCLNGTAMVNEASIGNALTS